MKASLLLLKDLQRISWKAGIGLCLLLAACEPESVNPVAEGVGNNLHFSFATPDWERKIDCTHLDLPSFRLNEQTYYTSATSQSTNSTFFISFPKDSSEIVKAANLKKYAIKEYGMNDEPFQFSLKLPLTQGSSERLVSQEGMSASVFNEVVSIQYEGIEENEAVFKIKGKYKMVAEQVNDPSTQKTVSGTYHFKIKTTRE